MPVTTFDPSEGPSEEQMAAEANALEQGEKIAQLQSEDRDRRYQEVESSNEDAELIGGKFKNQDDLLKAYEELQKKLSNPESTDEAVEAEEESTEQQVEEEVTEETSEVDETVQYMQQLGEEFGSSGELSEEAIDKLGSMDSKELIKAYLQYNAKTQAQTLQQSAVTDIQASVGGEKAYSEMISWASNNLGESEIADFNAVTATNNPVAIKFAVQALNARYKEGAGSEADLITSGKRAPSVQGYRSHAELSRDIADPRYSRDPAFRADVERKLSVSPDLL